MAIPGTKEEQARRAEWQIFDRACGAIFVRAVFIVARYSMLFALTAGFARAGQVFVSATAAAGGDGSEKTPYNSLADVERASASGDEIVVLPVPLNVAPLDGGIALKPGQKLRGGGPSLLGGATPNQAPRITNSSAARYSGDAVVLADNTEVSNMMIVNAYRGGVYGMNVTGIKIHENNFSGTNTSCTPGFYVMFPPDIALLPNGWAAILIDGNKGMSSLSIQNNYVHDGTCNDGIDIRATGTAAVAAQVEFNNVTRLAQGAAQRSVLAIGMQTRDTAQLNVTSDHNSETYIGSANADCEGLFANQTGGSLTWNINHNTFQHGIGGASCNGAEFYLAAGNATANLYVSNSTFEDDPGDMIQEVNRGTGSTINLTVDHVTVNHTIDLRHLPPEPKFYTGASQTNFGRCVDQTSAGHANVSNLRIFDSHFSDCGNDGIGSVVAGVTPAMTLPRGAQALNYGDGGDDSISIDVENSSFIGVQQDALHFTNQSAMRELSVKVENSRFSDVRGPATFAFDQNASTERAEVDLGGKEPDNPGGNCVTTAANLAGEATGYDVSAKSNWWGRAGGPAPEKISVTNGKFDFVPALSSAPAACGAGQ